MFNFCNIDILFKELFYNEQKKQIPIIKQWTINEVLKYRELGNKNLNLSTDGCWGNPRNGTHAIVSAIDREHDKVLYFSNVTKNVGEKTGNYKCGSNMMESQGVNDILNQIHKDDRIINSLTHDNDNKTNSLIKKDENAKIIIDPKHTESFIRKYNC